MEKKYKTEPEGDMLRIIALKDFSDVKVGDKGGLIEKEENLSQEGNCWVYEDAKVYGDAHVSGNAVVYDNAKVYGKAEIFRDARVYDCAYVSDNARVYDNAIVCGSARVFENARVFGNARVYNDAKISGEAKVYGDARVCGKAEIFGEARVFENAEVSSPTFALVNEYIGDKINIYHFDMYRIVSEEGLESTGFFDYDFENNIAVIEWSENIAEFLPKNTIFVVITPTGENDREIIIFK